MESMLKMTTVSNGWNGLLVPKTCIYVVNLVSIELYLFSFFACFPHSQNLPNMLGVPSNLAALNIWMHFVLFRTLYLSGPYLQPKSVSVCVCVFVVTVLFACICVCVYNYADIAV